MCIDIRKIEAQCKEQTKNEKYQVELGGIQGDRFLKYFRISVVNFTHGPDYTRVNIGSEEELTLASKTTIYFHIRFPKYFFDNELTENAFKTIHDQEQHLISKSTYKIDWKYFNIISLLDDQGFLSESVEKYESIKHEFSRSDFFSSNINNTKERYFYRAIVSINKNEQQLKRRFLKIQDVIAVSINFVKTVAATCYLINFYFSSYARSKRLTEYFFTTKAEHVTESLEIKVNTVVSKMQLTQEKKPEEKVGWIERIFCCWRQKEGSKNTADFFKQAKRNIGNCFEVVSIVRLFKNFEKLRDLALPEEEKEKFEELHMMNE